MSSRVIDLQKVDLYREGKRILHNFSFTLNKRESCVLLGPNGSGKTSLLMLLTKELYPAYRNGSWVKVFGRSSWNVRKLHEQFGIVSFDLQKEYPDHTTGREVVLSGFFQTKGIYPYQSITAKMERRASVVLKELGLRYLKNKPFVYMSTGEQRRCILGRALIHNPEYLILDEPTSGLDLSITFQYLEIIRNWIRKKKGVILVTHHIHEIVPEIERVLLMKQGRIIGEGTKPKMLTDANLSELYGTELKVFTKEGFYFTLPK